MSSLHMLHLNLFEFQRQRNISKIKGRLGCVVCLLPVAILQGNLPTLNNVKIFLRGAVAQQVTEPKKFNLPTVRCVLYVSESSNSTQNYFLEAVTLAMEGCPRSGIGQNILG